MKNQQNILEDQKDNIIDNNRENGINREEDKSGVIPLVNY